MAGAMTIAAIRGEAKEKSVFAELHAQVEQCTKKEGSNGKPFWELRLRDAGDALKAAAKRMSKSAQKGDKSRSIPSSAVSSLPAGKVPTFAEAAAAARRGERLD